MSRRHGLAIQTVILWMAAGSAIAQERLPSPRRVTFEGVVTEIGSGQPLQGVAIRVDTRLSDPRATTDAAGRFTIPGLDPGAYRIFAETEGMVLEGVCPDNGELPCADAWLPIGETFRIEMRMRRAATMRGRVIDHDGEPVPGVRVGLEVFEYASTVPGRRALTGFQLPAEIGRSDLGNCSFALSWEFGPDDPENATRCQERAFRSEIGRTITNAEGEWRIRGLTPGEYFVVASPEPEALLDGILPDRETGAWLPVYYPGTPDPDRASPVRVISPAEVSGVDILWAPHEPVWIRGEVSGLPDAVPSALRSLGFGPVDVRLEATAPDGRPVPLRGVSTTRSGASATFEIPVLPSREYVLVASAGLRYTGRTRVSVANEDVDGVAISIRPPADVQGQILFDPPPPPGALGQVSLHFFYKGLMGSMEVESRVSPDGTFSVPGLGARDFVIEPVGLPERYYIESASFGGLDPFRNLFNPAAAPGSLLLIRAASSPGRITGRVLDARGRPFESAEVTLVPEGNQAGRHDLYRSVLTGEDGAFALETIRPGAYRVFAWESIPENAGRNADFLAPYLGQGRFVTVGQNGIVDVEVDLIPSGF